MDLKPGACRVCPSCPANNAGIRAAAQNGRLVAGTGAGHEATRPLHTTRTRATGVAAGESTRGAAGPASRQDLARATLCLRPMSMSLFSTLRQAKPLLSSRSRWVRAAEMCWTTVGPRPGCT